MRELNDAKIKLRGLWVEILHNSDPTLRLNGALFVSFSHGMDLFVNMGFEHGVPTFTADSEI
jgi:hypothetical protein